MSPKAKQNFISPAPLLLGVAVFGLVAGCALVAAPKDTLSLLVGPDHSVDDVTADVARKIGPLMLAEAVLAVAAMYLPPGRQITASSLFAVRCVLAAAVGLHMQISERWGQANWAVFGFHFACAVGFAKCTDQVVLPEKINVSLRSREPVASGSLRALYMTTALLGGGSGVVLGLKPIWILDGNLDTVVPVLAEDVARLLGVFLLGEALLAFHLRDSAGLRAARVAAGAMATRALVATGTSTWNQLSGRWAAVNWSDPLMCAAFGVGYLVLGAPLFLSQPSKRA